MKVKLESISGLPPVRRRKRTIRFVNSKDPANLVFISAVSDEKVDETFAGEGYRRVVLMRYTVRVTVSFQQNTQFEEDPEEPLIWREQIRQKFYDPNLQGGNPAIPTVALEGAPSVYNCDYTLGEVYDATGEDSTYDSTSILLIFDSKEPANG